MRAHIAGKIKIKPNWTFKKFLRNIGRRTFAAVIRVTSMHKPPAPDTSAAGKPPMTWEYFRQNGISVVSWAKEHGYSPWLVYSILKGDRKCVRGKSAQIAKELGLK